LHGSEKQKDMKNKFLLSVSLVLTVSIYGQTVQLPFIPEHWNMSEAKYTTENYQGKECIVIQSGGIITKNVDLRDGTIEVDMSFPQQRGFPGIAFRVTDVNNCENFYVRPHQSGNPDASQYTPIFNGHAGWQLYHGEGYSKAFPYKFNQWHHIKIDVHGITAEIYIDDMQTPFIKVTELKRGWTSGSIALRAGNFPVRFANLQYSVKQGSQPAAIPVPANGTDGLITKYQVSNQMDIKLFAQALQFPAAVKSKLQWTTQSTESSGTINLAKFSKAGDSTRAMVARVVIESDKEQVKALSFGFSDHVIVYLNDKALYTGMDNYMSRDYRFLGTIGFFDQLFLPLKKGTNELWFVIAEDFGGWGVKAKLGDMVDVKLK
jgi:hypothetical protein